MLNHLRNIWTSFNNFWFSPLPAFPSSVFRLTVGLILFVFYTERFLDFDFLFSENGIFPYSLSVGFAPDLFKPPFLLYPASETWLRSLHLIFVCLLFLLALGIGGRVVAFCVWVLHLVFIQRNPVITYGSDFIATCWLMYMWFLKTDEFLTIKYWRKTGRFLPPWQSCKSVKADALNTVGVRFVQLQLCIIYGYSGMEKLKGVTWWRGDAVWNTLANGQLVTHNFGFLSYIPLVIVAVTFATIIFEVYFPILIWNKTTRPFILAFGIFLHSSIAVMMNIPFFALLMICPYVFFVHRMEDSKVFPP